MLMFFMIALLGDTDGSGSLPAETIVSSFQRRRRRSWTPKS